MSKALAFLAGGGAPHAAPRKLNAGEKLELIRIAAFSAGDTLTATEAISLIASLFKEDPTVRIDRARLAELLNIVTPPSRPRPRRLSPL
jgi:hypothetical protein